MGVTQYLRDRDDMPQYLVTSPGGVEDDGGLEHSFWRPLTKGKLVLLSELDASHLDENLLHKVTVFICFFPFLLVFAKFGICYRRAWRMYLGNASAIPPDRFTIHSAIVVNGPHTNEPQALRADPQYRVSFLQFSFFQVYSVFYGF